jgi:hypothetical protein
MALTVDQPTRLDLVSLVQAGLVRFLPLTFMLGIHCLDSSSVSFVGMLLAGIGAARAQTFECLP